MWGVRVQVQGLRSGGLDSGFGVLGVRLRVWGVGVVHRATVGSYGWRGSYGRGTPVSSPTRGPTKNTKEDKSRKPYNLIVNPSSYVYKNPPPRRTIQ